MRRVITKRAVDALAPGEMLADKDVRGFCVRRLPSGAVTYGFRYRVKVSGERRWLGLGLHGQITPDEARTLATKHAGSVADGRDPLAELKSSRAEATATVKTINDLVDDFMARYVRKNELRSADEIERCFDRYVRPQIGARPLRDLRRSNIVELLDKVDDGSGPVMADRVLAHLRKALNWYATRDDDFNSPIVRGMSRVRPKDIARDRMLADDEIRSLWQATDSMVGPFPAFVRVLLLTGQRRDEVSKMQPSEIEGNVWTIPAHRYKTKSANVVPLTAAVTKIIETQPKRGLFVFSSGGRNVPISGFSKFKKALDTKINADRKKSGLKPVPGWRLHDLRRTARSLMSRAGVPGEIAERVMGHVIPGVQGTYDRHDYIEQKRDALMKLAAVVDQIVTPLSDNVVQLKKRRRR